MPFGDIRHQLSVLLHQPLILDIPLILGDQGLFDFRRSGAAETDQTQRDKTRAAFMVIPPSDSRLERTFTEPQMPSDCSLFQ